MENYFVSFQNVDKMQVKEKVIELRNRKELMMKISNCIIKTLTKHETQIVETDKFRGLKRVYGVIDGKNPI